MSSLSFRKGDADSLLAYPKTWADILDKPDMLDDVAQRIIKMCDAAANYDYLVRKDTMAKIKAILRDVIVGPLSESNSDDSVNRPERGDNSILIDVLWEEIEGIPASLKTAFEKIIEMTEKIKEYPPLTRQDDRTQIKEVINKAVLYPLKGRNDDE